MASIISGNSTAALDRAVRRVLNELQTGLKHGYFEFTLTCEVIGGARRRFQLKAGKNYQFIIPAEECEPAKDLSDPRDEGAPESDS